MKKKKILLASIAVILAAILCIGGTLAYFTDVTDTKSNMFVVKGDDPTAIFNAELTEPAWDAYEGKDADGKAIIESGVTIPKDPTITLTDDSYEYGAWVAFKVIVKGIPAGYGIFSSSGKSIQNLLVNHKSFNATWVPGTNSTEAQFTYYHTVKLNKGESVTLFEAVQFPDDMTAEELVAFANFQIDVTGYAVSAEEFENADAARTALNGIMFPDAG